ncbi:unnamed protein product [Victoria cruziana]
MGWLTKDGQVSREGDKIHIDVPVEARKACYRARDAFYACLEKEVKHLDRQYCAKKRVQGLLDSDDPRRCSIALPQRYTFKP